MQKRRGEQKVDDLYKTEIKPDNNGCDDCDHNYIIKSGEELSSRFIVDSFIGKMKPKYCLSFFNFY